MDPSISASKLEYLHDSIVLDIIYTFGNPNYREIILVVDCHPNSGYPSWNGKRMEIRLQDVVISKHSLFGAISGPETVDGWDSRLSPTTNAELDRLRAAGISTAGQPFAISFHSGSELQGVCRRIVLKMDGMATLIGTASSQPR